MGLNNGLTGVSRIPTPYHWANKEHNIVFLRSQQSPTTSFQTVKRNGALGVKPTVLTYRFSTTIAGIV